MEESQSPELMDLRTKLIHAQKFADQVLRENFDLEQRVRILTDKLGFRSMQEAEESQSQPPLEVLLQEKLDSARKHIASLQKAAIESYEEHHSEVEILRKRINELENERLLSKEAGSLSMHRDINSSSDVDALKSEYEERIEEKNIVIAELKNRLSSQVPNLGSGTREKQLSSPIPDEMSPLIISSQNTADTAESLARLEARHAELERKYDLLRDEKRAISRKFSDHLKKWKNFKLWWLKEYEADKRDAENGANDPPNTNYIKRQRKIIAMQQALDSEGNDGPTALNKLLSSATEALKGHGEDAEGLAGRAPSEGSSSTRSGGIVPPKPSSPGVSLSSIEAGMQRVSNSGEGTDGAAALDSLLIEKNPPTICSGLPSAKSHTLETKLDNDALSAMPALDLHRSGSTPVPVFYPQGEMPTVVDMLHSRSPLLESVPVTPSGSHSKSSTIAEASLKSSPAQRVSTKMTSQRRGERNTGVEPRSRLSTSVHNPKRIPQEFIDDAETEPESKPHDGPRMPPRIHDTPGPRLQRQHSSPATTPRRHSKKPWLPNSAKLDTTYNNEEGVVVEDDAVPVPTSSLHRKSHSSASVLERRSSEPTSMTKEEREQYFKSLKGKTHEEYKREYAQFKGRGRYAHQPASGEEDEDIFLKYEIDKSKNDGLDYHFDGVVRKKQERQKLHGTDCLCCRDYYDAVGPLPSRLQPPLWRSPSPSESPSSGRKAQDRTGTYSPTSPNRDRTIKGHQQEVSRHRHNWAPPSTPPDYWTIGFPDTQQTKEINERARQMRAEKRKLIEEDAKKPDGRYRKRKK